jgi:hypothetical protein
MNASAAVGFTVRTGRAVTVIVQGTRRAPTLVLRHEIGLADPWVPESGHPYHRELGDKGPAGEQARRRGCEAARRASRRAIRVFLAAARAHGVEPRVAAVVTSSLIDPERVAGAHARAHAQEERLYRDAVDEALAVCGLPIVTFLDKNLRGEANRRIARAGRAIDETLKTFSQVVGTPWSAPEKQAALAAWLVLPR